MIKSYIMLLVTVIIYSSNLLVGKAVSDLSPITVTFFRLFIALLIVLPLGIGQVRLKRDFFIKEWKPLFWMSVTGIIVFNLLVYAALNFTSSTNAGIVESTTPVYTVLLGFFFLKERLNMYQLIGMILSLFGAIWVISKGSWEILSQFQFNIGDLLMTLAIILWSVYTIIVKKHNSKFPVYGGLLIMLSLAVVVLLPFAIIDWMNGVGPLFTFKTMMGLLYLGIFPSIIALIFWNKAVADIGASKASIFLNLLPVFTTIGAVLFLNEEIIAAQLIGGALVILGVVITTKVKSKKIVHNAEKEIQG